MTPDGPALVVDALGVEFAIDGGVVRAVDHVSFCVDGGETVAIVGESGSGKTVTALAVMGLVDPPGTITGGDIRLAGRSLIGLAERDYRQVRGEATTQRGGKVRRLHANQRSALRDRSCARLPTHRRIDGENPVEIDELIVGAWLDAADGTVDRDIAHRGLEALRHQGELALRLDEPMLAGPHSGDHPRLTTGRVLVPDRHRQRSTLVTCAHRQRRDVRLGQKLLAFFF